MVMMQIVQVNENYIHAYYYKKSWFHIYNVWMTRECSLEYNVCKANFRSLDFRRWFQWELTSSSKAMEGWDRV